MKSFVFFSALVALSAAGNKSPESYGSDSSSEEYPTYSNRLSTENRGSYGSPSLFLPAPYQPPAPIPEPYPAPAPEPYPRPEPQYPSETYPSEQGTYNNGNDFRKLRTLRADKVVRPKIRYYTHEKTNFAIISCPKNPTPGAYTWIVADSKDTVPSFGVSKTVALAGGLNIEFVAKYEEKHRKWEGRDLTDDDKQRFRRVGCVHGSTQSFVKI